MDILDRLDGAFASTGRVMAKVTPDRLDAPTPCTEWDVRALLNHTTGVVALFAAAAARRQQEGDPRTADWVGTDPASAFNDAAKTTLEAWSQPAALEGTCRLPIGELPAEVAAGVNLVDTLVHGWDLAKALGLDPTLDPALAAAALEVSKLIINDDLRGPSKGFGPLVAIVGGSPTAQLVAFLGRQP
jgi:uncharacterized protein (TIGR03086 family)